MSTKKKLKEISAALKKASAMHLGQSKDLDKLQASLDQVRYGKELFPGGKHSGTGGGGTGKVKKAVANVKRKIQSKPSKSDKEFAKARDERAANKRLEEEAVAKSNSMILNDEGYNSNFELNQSRKVLTQVSTGGAAGVGQMGNFPVAPNYTPPMPPPPAAMPAQPGMPVAPNQQVPPVPQDKNMMRTVKPLEKIPASKRYSNYKDFRGDMQKATIDDSTFSADSIKFKSGINPKYKLDMNMSYDYNKKNNPKAVEFVERMNQDRKYDPNKADINKNGTVEDWEKAKVSKFTK